MSLEQQADFKITATWEDNASAPLINSTDKINAAYKGMRREQLAVRREFEINNRTLLATGRVLSTVTGVVSRGIQVFQTYTLMQIRAQDATRNLREEQRRLDEILAESGNASQEFRDQLERTKEAEEELAQTTKDNLIGNLLNVVLILGVVGNSIIRVIPRIKELKATIGGVNSVVKSPIVSAPKPTGLGGKIAQGLGSIGKKLPLGGIAGSVGGAGLFLGQLAGEQTASAPTIDPTTGNATESQLPGGIEQLEKIGKDIVVHINNFINSPTPDQMSQDITEATKRSLTFSAGG